MIIVIKGEATVARVLSFFIHGDSYPDCPVTLDIFAHFKFMYQTFLQFTQYSNKTLYLCRSPFSFTSILCYYFSYIWIQDFIFYACTIIITDKCIPNYNQMDFLNSIHKKKITTKLSGVVVYVLDIARF